MRAEIINIGDEPTYVGTELQGADNALSKLRLSVFAKGKSTGGTTTRSAEDYGRYRDDDPRKPSLAQEFSRYWVVLLPGHFYGGDVTVPLGAPLEPGSYVVKGTYFSAGFQNRGMNNPLASYLSELAQLPYKAWTGSLETNAVPIKVIKPSR